MDQEGVNRLNQKFDCINKILEKHLEDKQMEVVDDIKRWMPKGAYIEEIRFGDRYNVHSPDSPDSEPVRSPIPEGHRNEPVHPDYYKGSNKDGKAIEVFDIIDQFVDGDFYLGNVLKYVCRAGKKSKETKKKDLEKALHYIMEAIKRCGSSDSQEAE
jgi:hypothetical protein